ncbi:MAG: SDR family oxidoreductase [Lentisphaeria bacterium]|jgi:pteridine reductase
MPTTVLITGAALRIGRAIAKAFAAQGDRVVIHYRHSAAAARELLAEIGGEVRGHRLIQADLADLDAAAQLIPDLLAQGLRLDGLVNNASHYSRRLLRDCDQQAMADAFAINFFAPFALMRAFARHCQRGYIINLLDQRVNAVDYQAGAYALAKKALRDATEAAALEWAPTIRVNAVAPGLVLPPPGISPERMAALIQNIPSQERSTEEEVAEACLYLAQARAVTGQILYIDGGLHLIGGNATGERGRQEQAPAEENKIRTSP